MNSKLFLACLATSAMSFYAHAQSSPKVEIYDQDFQYVSGEYSTKVENQSLSSIVSMVKLDDGSVLMSSKKDNKSFILKDGKIKPVTSFDAESAVLEALKFSAVADGSDFVFQNLTTGAFDGKGDFYAIYVRSKEFNTIGKKDELHKFNKTTKKLEPIDKPSDYKNFHPHKMVGVENGFVCILIKPIERDGSTKYEYRFSHYDGTQFNVLELPDSKKVSDVFKGKDGRVWVTGKNKVYTYADGQLKEEFSVGNEKTRIAEFSINSKGIALIDFTSGSVGAYNTNTNKLEKVFPKNESAIVGDESASRSIQEIEVDDKDRFVISASKYKMDFEFDLLKYQFESNGSLVILEYPNLKEIGGGVTLMNSMTQDNDDYKSYVGKSSLVDQEGNLSLLSLDGKTINKISKDGQVTSYSIEEIGKELGFSYPDYMIYPNSWTIDEVSGNIYISTPTRKQTFVLKADGSKEKLAFSLDKKLGGKTIKRVTFDSQNQAYWLATNKGFAFSPINGEPKYYTKKQTGIGTGYGLFEFRADTQGKLWVSHSKGVAVFDKDGQVSNLENENSANYISHFSIKDNTGRSVAVGSKGTFAISGETATKEIDFESLKAELTKKYGEENNSVFMKAAIFDQKNQLWVITDKNKVAYFTGSDWNIIDMKQYYCAPEVFTLFNDKEGRVNIVAGEPLKPVVATPTEQAAAAAAEAKKTPKDYLLEEIDHTYYFPEQVVVFDVNQAN
ncbi:hypothetical protein [Flammeovirga sp. SubArs3]|uniref:hypothetical protein n=1 Tax=Flammeovirga sp. SubArs3 TaxID=2995316 RepID=UPI00248C4A5E|nr:hypothetical protein [Flammeovirga sp. SubArs3]